MNRVIEKQVTDFQGLFILQALLLLLAVPGGLPYWFAYGLHCAIAITAFVIAWQLVRHNFWLFGAIFLVIAFLYNPVTMAWFAPFWNGLTLCLALAIFVLAMTARRIVRKTAKLGKTVRATSEATSVKTNRTLPKQPRLSKKIRQP